MEGVPGGEEAVLKTVAPAKGLQVRILSPPFHIVHRSCDHSKPFTVLRCNTQV